MKLCPKDISLGQAGICAFVPFQTDVWMPESELKRYERERKRAYREMVTNETMSRTTLLSLSSINIREREAMSGTFIDPQWGPSEQDREYAAARGYSPTQIDDIADSFRDYWLAKAGAAARMRDWSAAWRTWIRRERIKPAFSNVVTAAQFNSRRQLWAEHEAREEEKSRQREAARKKARGLRP